MTARDSTADSSCPRCTDQAARINAAFQTLGEAHRGGATVIRLDEMHDVLAGHPSGGGQQR